MLILFDSETILLGTRPRELVKNTHRRVSTKYKTIHKGTINKSEKNRNKPNIHQYTNGKPKNTMEN